MGSNQLLFYLSAHRVQYMRWVQGYAICFHQTVSVFWGRLYKTTGTMRFLISLQRQGAGSVLPLNYQYELSSVIYRMIDRADSAFSEFLHGTGYMAFGRNYRLFVFSRLQFDRFQVIQGSDRLVHEGSSAWFEISFLVDRAAEGFIRGLFLNQAMELGDRRGSVAYMVTQVTARQAPLFSEWMTYRSLSPLFIRRKRLAGGEDYLHPEERDFWILLVRNLVAKQQALALASEANEPADACLPDFGFKVVGKVYKNGVTIKQHTARETKLIGYAFEFSLRLPKELQEIGYYGGFGHLGSQGFGCVEVKGGGV